MTTTPEQLAKYREEFEKAFPHRKHSFSREIEPPNSTDMMWQGYLRAKQETEQAIKDARKQALKEAIALFNQPHVEHFGSNIVEMLEELLK